MSATITTMTCRCGRPTCGWCRMAAEQAEVASFAQPNVTVTPLSHGGGSCLVRASCDDREELERWLEGYFDRWPLWGYGTMHHGVQFSQPPLEGWYVDVRRAESCD